MQNLNNEQKLQVLLHALEERYKSIHIIRERVQNISLWILGLFVTAGGWLLQSATVMTERDKWFFTLAIVISVGILRVFYLADLQKGFKVQQRIQAKIEDELGLCSPGVYSQESIYPKTWSHAGTKKGRGNFFFHNYILIYLATSILVICIWFT